MKSEKKRKRIAPEKFFRAAAAVWIEVYGEVMLPDEETGEVADPEFWTDGAEKKHLKLILTSLRERAEKNNVEWTEGVMKERLRFFLLRAFDDKWLSENFMLRLINQCKAKIFNNQITPKKNGKRTNTNSTAGKTIEFDRP